MDWIVRNRQFVLVFTLVAGLYACINTANHKQERFITRDGLEPDTWASVWLVKTIIAPESEVIIRPSSAALGRGTAFAVPEADYKRTRNSAAFASLIDGYELEDPVLRRMANILIEIETASWGIAGTEADVVEQGFRRLQEQHGRMDVPVSCYMSFFQQLYRQLQTSSDPLAAADIQSNGTCEQAPLADIRRDDTTVVAQIPINELLTEIAAGEEVIFVDTREPEEFQASHIPGAINIPLRDVAAVDPQLFEGADRVVSYCIKDFRGYEVARALAEKGVKNSSTMRPYGFAGWQSLGLPITLHGQKDSVALSELAPRNELPAAG